MKGSLIRKIEVVGRDQKKDGAIKGSLFWKSTVFSPLKNSFVGNMDKAMSDMD